MKFSMYQIRLGAVVIALYKTVTCCSEMKISESLVLLQSCNVVAPDVSPSWSVARIFDIFGRKLSWNLQTYSTA